MLAGVSLDRMSGHFGRPEGGPGGPGPPPMGLRVVRWSPLGLARGPFGETGRLPGGALGPPRVFVGPNRENLVTEGGSRRRCFR